MMFSTAILLLLQSLLCTCVYESGNTIHENNQLDIYGNEVIPAIFDIHEQSNATADGCGNRVHRTAILHIEAMRYATKMLNKVPNERNTTWKARPLQYVIYDYCSNTSNLVRTALGGFKISYIPLIGPASKDISILGILHQRRNLPILSPLAPRSSCFQSELSNEYAMLPSAGFQLSALVDFLEFFKWNFVSVITLGTPEGFKMKNSFKDAITKRSICIDTQVRIPDAATEAELLEITESLKTSKAKVVVMLTMSYNPRLILEAAKKMPDLFWLLNAGWFEGNFQVREVMALRQHARILMLDFDGMEDHGFKNYFLNLTLKNNNYSSFRQFWSQEFKCNLGSNSTTYRNDCSGKESLYDIYNDDDFPYATAKAMIDSVYLYGCMIQSASDRCNRMLNAKSYYYYTWTYWWYYCPLMRTGTFLLPTNMSQCIGFEDFQGFKDIRYIPRDLKISLLTKHKTEVLGVWKYNRRTGKGSIKRNQNITLRLPISVCSSKCKAGEAKFQLKPKCCFKCLKRTDVTSYPIWMGLSYSMSCIGILLTTVVLGIYIKHRNSRVIKASSKELSFMMLLALYTCFSSSFIYVTKPTLRSCPVKKVMFGLSFTLIYTPLLLKIIRLYRILKAAQVTTLKPILISPRSQIMICISLIALQLLLGFSGAFMEKTKVSETPGDSTLSKHCDISMQVLVYSVAPCFILMIACTVLASKTRHCPENFNEASSIGFTMYISAFLWGIFIPAIIFLNGRYMLMGSYIVSFFTTAVGMVTLVGLFWPRCARVLFARNSGVQPAREYTQNAFVIGRAETAITEQEDQQGNL